MLNLLVGLGIGVLLGAIIGWLLALRGTRTDAPASGPAINPLQSLVEE